MLRPAQIREMLEICNDIKKDMVAERRNGIQQSLKKLEEELSYIEIPEFRQPEYEQEHQWVQKQAEYKTELQSKTEPIRIKDIRELEKTYQKAQDFYRRMQLATELPLDRDLLELKIKEKMVELETLRNSKANFY
eukprot:NODE_404_length_9277_cov_0.359407.p7 type:complete len:135 gc:universal NODE_404_length_9277_cov_0.359407:1145-741(-)